jgi:hypothetical protein
LLEFSLHSPSFTVSLQPAHAEHTGTVDTFVRMRWKLLLAVLVTAILAVPVALGGDAPGDGTLSVKRGRGTITIKFKGTVIGRINGKIWVRDYTPNDDTVPQLTGCKNRVRHPGGFPGYTVCRGKNVSFRILDGKYKVGLIGNGIFLSAVGYGWVTVDGYGDLGINDGVMSLNDQPYHSLPDFAVTYQLEAPPPQPQPGG